MEIGGFNHKGNQPFPTDGKNIPFGNQELSKEDTYQKRFIVAINGKCNFVLMFYCGLKVGVYLKF